jgi:hypothetical protein
MAALRGARRATATALVIAASILVALGLAEGLTRRLLPAFDPSGRFEFSYPVGSLNLGQPGVARRQTKNTGDYDVAVSINAHGLRDAKDISLAGPGDLVVVGDSFAWGWGVEADDRFSDRLQALTGRQAFNLATPTDLAGYEVLLEYARSLGARIGQVVLAVCLENDLALYDSSASASGLGDTVRGEARDDATDWKQWLAERSAVYLLLTTAIHRTPWLEALAVRAGAIVPTLEGMPRNSFAADVIDSSAAKLEELSKRYRLLVVLIPSRALWVGENRAVEDRIHRALATALAARGVPALDLRPLFEAGGAPLAFHFANDGHWNPRGHRLAAEAIAGCLTGAADTCLPARRPP